MADRPRGTVTFLFSDVEGSTQLLRELGDEYAEALAEHRRIMRSTFAAYGGTEVDTQGDAFFVAFARASDALAAAEGAQRALTDSPIRVRIGLHTGEPLVTAEGYVGMDVHRAARIAAAGNGGQVLLSQATRDLIEADVTDLGEHRLKDLSAPERLYQLGHQDFPPLMSLGVTNLPSPSTPFLGRERELGEVTALLRREDVRLVTLTGAGGTGKTRLALQAAADLADCHPDGIFWVGLASLLDHVQVLPTIAHAIGAKHELADAVGAKRMLIVVDNLEHLLQAAPDLAVLLAGCPGLNLLVTSRERLRVTAEHVYAVPPLTPADAVSLFAERAAAARSGFAADDETALICHRLDGLPLALELAAARVNVLSQTAILERLEQRLPLLTGGARDLPERQRTLRGAIQWSYELLGEDEQRLFARFSVFAGGCRPRDAEHVCAVDLDALGSLVDKSLLERTDDRLWMLETIREYALERLEELGDADEVRLRHARHFLRLAEAVGGELAETDDPGLAERLQEELPNFRAALRFCEQVDAELGLRLATALGAFWAWRSPSEGQRALERFLADAEGADAELRVRAVLAAAEAAYFRGAYGETEALCRQGLTLAREIGADLQVGRLLTRLGAAVGARGDLVQERMMIDGSLTIYRRLDHKAGTALALMNLGDLEWREGSLVEARGRCEEALEVARDAGALEVIASASHILGMIALEEGDVANARRRFREGLELHVKLGDWTKAYGLLGVAAAAAASGDSIRAGRLWGAFLATAEESEAQLFPGDREWYERFVFAVEGALFAAAVEEGRTMSPEQVITYALG